MDEKLDYWSKRISEAVLELRTFSIEGIKGIIGSHIKLIVHDLLKTQIGDLQRILETQTKIKKETGNHSQGYIQNEINKLKSEIKAKNILRSDIENAERGKEMTIWMKKYHPESLTAFYKHWDSEKQDDELSIKPIK